LQYSTNRFVDYFKNALSAPKVRIRRDDYECRPKRRYGSGSIRGLVKGSSPNFIHDCWDDFGAILVKIILEGTARKASVRAGGFRVEISLVTLLWAMCCTIMIHVYYILLLLLLLLYLLSDIKGRT
jgi:hypothetical protein